jgi:carbon-monoxide dehydrogenase medium subunit
MSPDYREPASLDELFALLTEHGPAAVPLAGGSALFPLAARPGLLVGLRRLGELRGIRAEPGGVWIGPMTTHRGIEHSSVVLARMPVLAETAAKIGSVRIRNQATIGGNLARADPGWDPPPTLIALDAVAVLAGPGGYRREVPVDRLVHTGRRPAELIVGIRVPTPHPGTRTAHVKVRARSAAGGPLVAVAVAVRLDADGRISHARLALGAVGPAAIRAVRAERALEGRPAAPEVLAEAAELAAQDIDPPGDIHGGAGYRREMARVWVRRALTGVTA